MPPTRRRCAALADAHPGRIALRIGYDEALAHRIEAGADIFLMPSRFEPCGLNQMYSLRYGTVPVVRNVGGLADTVVDATPEALADGSANGFSFSGADAAALVGAARRALAARADAPLWTRLQLTGMRRRFLVAPQRARLRAALPRRPRRRSWRDSCCQ